MATKKSGAIASPSDEYEKKWQAEDDLRTLTRMVEINKDPKRLAAAKKLAREKLAEMKAAVEATASIAK